MIDTTQALSLDNEVIPDTHFTYEGYQVVRGEFFAHTREPSVSFSKNKITFNNSCIRRLPDVDFIQILINSGSQKMVVRPCSEDSKDALAWNHLVKGVKKSKPITCRLFFAKVMSLMDWNPSFRYKLLGKVIRNNGEILILFDLTATETYVCLIKDGEKARMSRQPVFPEEWKNQFGLPVDEHQKLLQVNIFDGYTVFGVTDEQASANKTDDEKTNSNPDVQERSEQ